MLSRTLIRGLLLAAALTAVVVAIYWPGLGGPLVLDDLPNLLPLKILHQEGRLSFQSIMQDRLGGIDGRPVAMFSFFVNFKVTGDSIWWMKATNLAIHLLCGLLVFGITRLALQQPPYAGEDKKEWATWVTAAWLLAPIQVSTVLYTIQRMTGLAAMFSLATLLAYLWARRRLTDHPMASSVVLGFAWCVLWPLAILSKQSAAIVPALAIVLEVFFLRRANIPPAPPWLVPSLMALLVLLAALFLGQHLGDAQWLERTFAVRDFTVGERLLTQARVLFDYAMNVLSLPGGRALGLFHDDLEVSRSLFVPPQTILSVAGLLAIAGLAWWSRAGPLSPVIGGIVFFLVGHAVESTFLPLEMYFEHRNYLPSLGLFLSVAALAAFVSMDRKILILGVLLLTVAGYGLFTAVRVDAWRDWPSLVSASANAHPRSVRGRAALAVLSIQNGQLAAANGYLDEVLRMGGENTRAAVALERLVAYCISGQSAPESVQASFAELDTIEDDPYTVAALAWFSQTVEDENCAGSVDIARVANKLDLLVRTRRFHSRYRKRWSIYRDLGILLVRVGRAADGAQYLRRSIALAPVSRREQIERLLHLQHQQPPSRSSGLSP